MNVELFSWQQGWQESTTLNDAELVLYFAASSVLRHTDVAALLRQRYPHARQVGCSTGGEIAGAEVFDHSVAGVAVKFARSRFDAAATDIAGDQEREAGAALAQQLSADDLKLVFVLADGLNVNGSELVRGFQDVLPGSVLLTGGLAGDGAEFGETYVGLDDRPEPRKVVALGFYGEHFHCGSGCMGGWSLFGPKRMITRSDGNILYELDDMPALDLYKDYLGEEIEELPGSALLYPLAIRAPGKDDQEVVRTIVGIDEDAKSLIFAGDVPESYSAQLMTSSFSQLADGAQLSAEQASVQDSSQNILAILVSCIGRKLLMGPMVVDEVDAVKYALPTATLCGFYSYGEIAPHGFTGSCELHNQTMTITTIWES